MTVKFLAAMLTADTVVIVRDAETGRTLYEGPAGLAAILDRVKDWDFSRGHIIYI